MCRKTCSGFAVLFIVLLLAVSPARVLAQQIGTDITSITTQTISTPGTTVSGVPPNPGSPYALPPLCPLPPCVYTMIFGGDVEFITDLSFAGGRASVDQAIPARAYLRRSPVADARQDAIYKGTFDGITTFTFPSFGPVTDEAMLNLNNILMGNDQLFMNVGICAGAPPPPDPGTPDCPSGASSPNTVVTIEREDFILEKSVNAVKSRGFAVFEQGLAAGGPITARGHDGFAIAAITGVDRIGNPTSYGPIHTIVRGTWGLTPVVEAGPPYQFLGNSAQLVGSTSGNPRLPINPFVQVGTDQSVGGILIRADELVDNPSTKIFGYSLFATDVTCTPETLVDISDPCFPKNTPGGAGGGIGGLDLMAANLGALKLKDDKHKDKDK